MSKDIFIGREKELQMIEDMVFDPIGANHYLPIIGVGGVGKTSLMRELYKRYNKHPDIAVLRLEFGEVNYQSFPLLILQAMEQLSPYISSDRALELRRTISNWEQLMTSVTAVEKPQKIMDEVFQLASDTFMEANKKKRFLLLSDTTETIKPVEYGYYLNAFAATAQNAVIVAGGRPTESVLTLYKKSDEIYEGWIVHDIYELKPFSIKEADVYFQNIFQDYLSEEVKEKIFFLTDGNPVLISVAGEWFNRHIALPNDIDLTLEQLYALDLDSLAKYRKRFEFELIDKIRALRNPIDWSVLYLAFLNRRYNKKILKLFFPDFSKREIEEVISELQSIIFMRKSMSGDSSSLHDEAQRLIREHAWPIVDPDGNIRRNLALKVINDYYLPEIERLRGAVDSVVNQALKQGSVSLGVTIPPIPPEDILKQTLQIECLDYQFRVSQKSGLAYLDQLLIESRDKRSFVFFDTINQAIYNLDPEKQKLVAVQVRLAEILMDRKQTKQAINLAHKVLNIASVQSFEASRAFNILGQLSNNPKDKIRYFESALEKVEALENIDIKVVLLNNLGLLYRQMGQWGKAENVYRQALNLLDKKSNISTYANILNNLAYVVMLRGNPERADMLAERALRLRKNTANRRGLAYSYFTKGHVADAKGDYAAALRAYQTAMGWFTSISDNNSIAWVQISMAQLNRRANNFITARELLVPALACDRLSIQAEAFSQAAKVDLDEAEALSLYQPFEGERIAELYASARQYAQQTLSLAESIGYQRLKAVVLFDLALITWLSEKRESSDHISKLEKILAEYDFPLEKAHLVELKGTIAYEDGQIVTAFENYFEACRILANYSTGRFRRVLERVRGRFLDTKSEVQIEICEFLAVKVEGVYTGSPLASLKSMCLDILDSTW